MRMVWVLLLLAFAGCAGTEVRQVYQIDGNPADTPTFSAKFEISHKF